MIRPLGSTSAANPAKKLPTPFADFQPQSSRRIGIETILGGLIFGGRCQATVTYEAGRRGFLASVPAGAHRRPMMGQELQGLFEALNKPTWWPAQAGKPEVDQVCAELLLELAKLFQKSGVFNGQILVKGQVVGAQG